MSTPKTFEAHGHIWTAHTPGDPMPCEAFEKVEILLRDQSVFERTAAQCCWGNIVLGLYHERQIIGWRYADEPQDKPKTDSAWRPIAEAPKDDTPIDIWSKSNGRLTNYFRSEHENGDLVYDPIEDGVTTVRDATHFMPLPEPPTE